MFACKCLNITQTKFGLSEFYPAAKWILRDDNNLADDNCLLQNNKLTAGELDFFSKAVGPINVNVKEVVFVRHQELVHESQCGEANELTWTVNLCIGCETYTHASAIGGNQLILNPQCITSENDVRNLKTSPNYSTAFKILMTKTTRDLVDLDNVDEPLPHIDSNTERLNNIFLETIQQEIKDTDERIRVYSEKQFALLHIFKTKAEHDLKTLSKLMQSARRLKDFKEPPTVTDGATKGRTTNPHIHGFQTKSLIRSPGELTKIAENSPNTNETNPKFLSQSKVVQKPTKLIPVNLESTYTSKPVVVPSSQPISLNDYDDIHFEMDGFTAQYNTVESTTVMSDIDESDTEEDNVDHLPSTGPVSIARSQTRPTILNIAQSLPISMPNEQHRSSFEEADNDDLLATDPNDQVDIAASIKALARSVHGEAVFGDLPRPRFSYQI